MYNFFIEMFALNRYLRQTTNHLKRRNMKTILLTLALLVSLNTVQAADHDPKSIIPLLKDSKVSLLDAISYAIANSGPATSAKFEVANNKLMVSIYTVPEGLNVEAEKATLTEFSGPAIEGTKGLKAEIFVDKEHIARASVHMTLFQLSRFDLTKVVQIAVKRKPGTAIDVRNPIVRNERPVADVVIVDKQNQVSTVTVDLLSGKTSIQ